MMFNKNAETMSRLELEKVQLERLKSVAERVYNNVPFYKNKFDEKGVKPSDIKTLKDIDKLPFTIKTDLRDNYPKGMFAVNNNEIVRIHASSGTTGKPTIVGYTKSDIDIWAELVARSFASAGMNKNDTLQCSFGYGLFTGGLGAHYGGERLGASVLPTSGGNSKRQIMLMKDLEVDGICCTPSYALSLIDVAREMGEDVSKFKIRVGIFGAEPWTVSIRNSIEAGLGIDAIDIYGLSEIMGPGVSCECREEKDGMHINEDHFIVETINPETCEVLTPGSIGELVFTTITKEGMPLIRYRTRDISKLNTTQCSCGRTFYRMSKVMGRSDDMLIIRGVNVFPSQIESVITKNKSVHPHYMIYVDRDNNLDTIEVHVEVDSDIFFDVTKRLQLLEKTLQKDIKDIIGITARVRLVEPKSLARFEGKSQRVVDRRTL